MVFIGPSQLSTPVSVSPLSDRVFEPFVTTKPPGSGTGLGLATASAIINCVRARRVDRNQRLVRWTGWPSAQLGPIGTR